MRGRLQNYLSVFLLIFLAIIFNNLESIDCAEKTNYESSPKQDKHPENEYVDEGEKIVVPLSQLNKGIKNSALDNSNYQESKDAAHTDDSDRIINQGAGSGHERSDLGGAEGAENGRYSPTHGSNVDVIARNEKSEFGISEGGFREDIQSSAGIHVERTDDKDKYAGIGDQIRTAHPEMRVSSLSSDEILGLRDGVKEVDQLLQLLHRQAGKETKRIEKEKAERRKEMLKDQEFMMDKLASIIDSLQKTTSARKETVDDILRNEYIPDIVEFPTMIVNENYIEKLDLDSLERDERKAEIIKLKGELKAISNSKQFFKPSPSKIETSLFYEEKMGPWRRDVAITSAKPSEVSVPHDSQSGSAVSPTFQEKTGESSFPTLRKEEGAAGEFIYSADGKQAKSKYTHSYRLEDPKIALESELNILFQSSNIEDGIKGQKSPSFGRLTPTRTTSEANMKKLTVFHETKGALKRGSPSVGRIRGTKDSRSRGASESKKTGRNSISVATVGRLSSPSKATTIDKMRVEGGIDVGELDIETAKEALKKEMISSEFQNSPITRPSDIRNIIHSDSGISPSLRNKDTVFVEQEGHSNTEYGWKTPLERSAPGADGIVPEVVKAPVVRVHMKKSRAVRKDSIE